MKPRRLGDQPRDPLDPDPWHCERCGKRIDPQDGESRCRECEGEPDG